MNLRVWDAEEGKYQKIGHVSTFRLSENRSRITLYLEGLSNLDAQGIRYVSTRSHLHKWECRGLFRVRNCYVVAFEFGQITRITLTPSQGFFQ